MKRTLLLLALQLGCTALIHAQAPSFQWARTCDKVTKAQTASMIVTDKYGSVYLAGNNSGKSYYPDRMLDSGNFIVKYRHDGKFFWSRSIPGTIRGIDTDADGFLYVAANFSGSVVIDQFKHYSNGHQDFFVTKLDGGGSVIWSINFGGQGFDGVNDIAVSSSNFIHLAGYVTGPVVTGGFLVPDTGFFVTRLSPLGVIEWALSKPSYSIELSQNYVGRGYYPGANEIETDLQNNIYVLGDRQGDCDYCYDYLLTKFSASGLQLIEKNYWSIFDYPGNLKTDKNGNVYLMYNTGSHYTSSFILQKYDPNLSPLWSRWLGNGYSNFSINSALAFDGQDNPVVTGWLGGGNYWTGTDTVIIDSTQYITHGNVDAALWQFDGMTGKTQWLKLMGGKKAEYPTALCNDRVGNIYLANNTVQLYGESTAPFPDTCYFDEEMVIVTRPDEQAIVAKLLTSDFEFEEGSAGLQKHRLSNPLNIYPNPGTGEIIFTGNFRNGILTVMDVTGRKIAEQPVQENKADFLHLERGIYTMRLSSDEGIFMGTYVRE
jgi:hypothetical protein